MKTSNMRRLPVWVLAVAVVLTLALPASAFAQGPGQGDKVIFGSDYTLSPGEVLTGNLVVFGGDITLQHDSAVNGDVAAIGGNIVVAGTVTGNLTAMGGNVGLDATAVIEGDIVNLGGSLSRDPGAIVKGNIARGFGLQPNQDGAEITIPSIPPLQLPPTQVPGAPRPPTPARDFAGWVIEYLLRGLSAIAWAAVMAALGVLLVVLAPRPTLRVGETAEGNPVLAFGAGFLALVLGIPLLALLAITICLIPLAAIGGFLLIVGWFFGWLAVGWLLGKRLLVMLKVEHPTAVFEMVAGVVVLTLFWRLPLTIPFVGWLLFAGVGLIAGCIGLGAVLLSRFGTQTYAGSGMAASPALQGPSSATPQPSAGSAEAPALPDVSPPPASPPDEGAA